MNLHIDTIEHRHQRYDTCGDWQFNKVDCDPHAHEHLEIRVSRLGDERFEALVALHEMVEALLCREHGVDEAAVTAFDMQFEEDRERDLAELNDELDHAIADDWAPDTVADIRRMIAIRTTQEPGDHPAAPYHSEHIFANAIERRMAEEMGICFADYEAAIARAGE